jgi:hypothetical protein
MAVGLPLIVLLFDRIFLAGSWRPLLGRGVWYALLVLPLIAAAFLIVPSLIGSGDGTHTVGFDLNGITSWSYFTSQPRVLLEYIRLSIIPLWQSLDYGWLPPRETSSQWLGLAGWLLLASGIFAAWRRSRPLGFLLLTALLVLAPSSTLLPLQDIIFEHRFYLPLACLLTALFGSAFLVFGASPGQAGVKAFIIACLLALPLSWLTMSRNLDYTSASRMHAVDTENHPDNPRAWYALATTASFDRPEPKIRMLERAIDLSKDRQYFYAGTDYKWPRDLADTLLLSGQLDRARPQYESARVHCYDPLQQTEIEFRLAMIASMQSRDDEAEALFQTALAGDKRLRRQIELVYAAHRDRLKKE